MEANRVQTGPFTGEGRGPNDSGTAVHNRRIVVPRFGGPDLMKVVEEEIPEPGPGEVRVRIVVAGIGFPDVVIREGTYPGGPKPPFTPGYDFIGTVDKLGVGVTGVDLGQTVGAITVYGSYADYLCVPASWLVQVPAGLDPAEAVSLVFNYVTAYQMLHRAARVKKGDRLLVHGAAGGVGTAVLQLGQLAGLELFGTASGTQTGVVAALGATPIDYTKGSFLTRIRELTDDGVDVVLDGIGGRVALRSYRALRRGGRLVMFGHYSTLVEGRKSVRRMAVFYLSAAMVFAANLVPDGKRVLPFQVAKLRDRHPEWFREDATTLFDLLSEGKLKPIVSERIPLVEARRAHENLGRGGVTGKQVLICDAEAMSDSRAGRKITRVGGRAGCQDRRDHR
jgi:NADPH:quinone reductase